MCGIGGSVGDGVLRPEVADLANAMRHRGPDDGGFYFGDGVALVHRRLSIIDLDTGGQPIANEDETVWVTFNGVIYNYRQLRVELQGRGHRFRTAGDCEVLVHLYEDEGAECVRRLRGMFAFAIWDARSRRLFAACDRTGQKPFFYAESGGSLRFASEIKALLAADPSLAELDPESFDQYLELRFVAPPRTMFRRIRKLPAAHRLSFDARRGLRVERYWDIDFEPKRAGTDDDLLEEVEARLAESVRLHSVSDVPLGAFLSGGLDSPLVVATLRAALPSQQLRTYCGSLRYQSYDEAPFARLVAERCGTQHQVVEVRPPGIAALAETIAHLDEPGDSLAVCFDAIAAAASRDVKVLLGGDGGDELFGGYDRYLGFGLAAVYAQLPTALRHAVLEPIAAGLASRGWYRSPGNQLRWLQRHARTEPASRYASILSHFGFDRRQRLEIYGPAMHRIGRDGDPGLAVRTLFGQARAEHALDRMTYVDWQLRLPGHSLMMLDRTSMARGVEARSPLLDHELVELGARLPPHLKVRGRQLRWLQRRLAARYLPAPLLRRPKQGFPSALPYMQSRLGGGHARILGSSRLAAAGLLDQRAVDRLVGSGHDDGGQRLWMLLSAELWFRSRVEGNAVHEVEAAANGSGR